MGRHVVDASVILKWVFGEEQEADRNKALGLLNGWVEGRVELLAPDLWVYEVGNFLGRQLPGQTLEKLELLLNLRVPSIALTENMLRLCFDWMARNGVTFYDASYLAVAEETKSILVTADAKFAEKMGRPQSICLLRDI
ncbi:MAG: type II toxin-antitoxin system VapC family toxin [Syntrophobacteraceae bacterium]